MPYPIKPAFKDRKRIKVERPVILSCQWNDTFLEDWPTQSEIYLVLKASVQKYKSLQRV